MENELSDEEIWLRAYCSSMMNDKTDMYSWKKEAEICLNDFRERFRQEE